ncbi:S-adenosyl-L-methionine-dependent methyltransferase [Phytophthora cactorum]|nr:S-adenosyl-L-methionine-dependent methyltransferase [Phytophthora cactorum]
MSEQQQPAASPATSEDREAWLKTGSKDESDDKDEANPFSQYYGMLLHQQNMLQDHVRTGTYERAMLSNPTDFRDKVVLDVGTGSGILAFFAIKAGARKVYAVELSNMAECARELVAANGLSDRITVIKGKMEEVDVVVSEPMGFFLVHERMLETFVTAGKKWRRPAPSFKMFPSIGTMFMSPFSDDSIYREQMAKVAFWQQQDFYGVNLSSLRARAMDNHFSQPVVGYFPPDILLSSRFAEHVLDFADITKDQLDTFDFPFHFVVERTAIMHGLGCWFTVDFLDRMHCRLLLSTPVAVNASQSVSGNLHFVANKKFSYDIDLEVRLDGTSIVSRNHIRLHDQMYHYLYSPGAASGAATDGMQQQNSSY